jgi:hypothetical protein
MQKHEPHCTFEQPPNIQIIGLDSRNRPIYQWMDTLRSIANLRCTCRVSPGLTLAEFYLQEELCRTTTPSKKT